jgi:anti-sigma factor RsiW
MTEINLNYSQESGHLSLQVLNAFVDGEVWADAGTEIQKHLEDCHACTLRALSVTRLKAATARGAARFATSPEALARLSAQLRTQVAEEHSSAAKQIGRVVRFPARSASSVGAWSALAAAILLAFCFAAWQSFRQANRLTSELLDQHLATLAGSAEPQVISTDKHTVKPWFQGRIPFSFNLPEPDALPPDTMLRGADLVYVEGHPTALLLFTIHKHQVSMFVAQRNSEFAVTPRSTHAGFTLRSATTNELRLTAVSDVNPTELEALVQAVLKVQ